MILDRLLDLRAVKAEDDVAGDVGDGDAAEVAIDLVHQLFVSGFILFNVLGDVRDTKFVEPLHFRVAKGTPAGAINGDLWVCCAHKKSSLSLLYIVQHLVLVVKSMITTLARLRSVRYNNTCMSASPKTQKEQPAKSDAISGATVIIMTALDTTWRAFVPTIGGTFLGIWLDSLFGSSPIALIICLIVGAGLSFALIAHQLITVRK
jgi:F0F1-type ATP synthase assembly protein I